MIKYSNNLEKTYDLEERTAKFGENLIDFLKSVNRTDFNCNIIKQLLKSGTSIGANYYEANASSSRKDFRNKIYISKKESNETKYWIRVLARANPDLKDKLRKLWQEAHEFHLIFQKITKILDKRR